MSRGGPKKTKTDAKYQNAPRSGMMCGGCTMFREPNRCTLVSGDIAPRGWCRFFDPKKKK